MKKYLMDLKLVASQPLSRGMALLKLAPCERELPPMRGGQFVNIQIPQAPDTLLRRPISICNVDAADGTLWLLVRGVGNGTRTLCSAPIGSVFSTLLPLGNGFSMPENAEDAAPLLIGGGVGIAPLLYWGKELSYKGIRPSFLLGARTAEEIVMREEFLKYGDLHISTEDGSDGEKGFVTAHSVLNSNPSVIYCCGPTPMMKAVAGIAENKGIPCEVSLENMMACGLGACLCCVQNTDQGHKCSCTDGPVFNSTSLKW